ncbi:MAG: hypothetical protein WDN23_04210 [Edaphobacter sp.]
MSPYTVLHPGNPLQQVIHSSVRVSCKKNYVTNLSPRQNSCERGHGCRISLACSRWTLKKLNATFKPVHNGFSLVGS